MATVNITIPATFIQQVNQFMVNVQKMQGLVTKLNYTTQQMPAVQSLYASHLSAGSRFRSLIQTFSKFSSSLQKTLDSIISSMGTAATTFMRGVALVADALGPIIGITVGAAVTVGHIAVYAGAAAYKIMKWAWDKMVGLGDSLLQDWLISSGIQSSIGGLRAFRTAFGGLPGDIGVSNFAQVRGSMVSKQYAAMQLLKIRATTDTADMMMQATIAASRFMKKQQKGSELRMAGAFALTSLFDPQRLLALREMDEAELEAMKKLYLQYKPLLEISAKAREGWIKFRIQLDVTKAQIASVIAEKLADPNSPFVQSLKKLSDAFVHFIKVFADAPVTDSIIKKLGYWIDRFGKYLNSPETDQKLQQFLEYVKDIVKSVINAISILKKIIAEWTGKDTYVLSRVEVFRPGIRRPGAQPSVRPSAVQVYRPGIRRPGAVAPSAVQVYRPGVRRPGTVRPDVKPSAVQVYRPGVRRPGRVTPAEAEAARAPARAAGAPALKAPKAPAEAPETVEGAVKGGFRKTTGGGVVNRDWAREEIENTPGLKDKIFRIAANEQGDNPSGQVGVMESMINRAKVRGTSVAAQAKWYQSEKGYYEQGNMGRGALENPVRRGGLEKSYQKVIGGSNITDGATDNSSGSLAAREKGKTWEWTHRKDINGESFFTRNSEDKKRIDRLIIKPVSDTPGIEGLTVDQLQKGLKEDGTPASPSVSNVPASTAVAGGGDSRLTAVGNYRLGGDSRRQALLNAAGTASKNLPPGWHVEAYSGERTGAGQGPHATGGAIDFRLIDPNGHMVENYQHPENFAVYERFAQDTHAVLQQTNPELAREHRWGGYFSGPIGAGGQYGAMDLMHQDFAGGNARMAAGQWDTGVNEGWKQRWGVGEHSPGIAARAQERERLGSVATPPAASKPEWPEKGTTAWDEHPANNVKVDNRSDHDIGNAKSHSDNDSGSTEPAEDNMPTDI